MKVSVIVTTHNTERYLLKCMDSIFNQTLSDIEIIIADDESQGDMLIPILEDVPEGEHYGYGRAATEIQEKTVSTFVKTKVLTEISISTLGFSVSRIVKP